MTRTKSLYCVIGVALVWSWQSATFLLGCEAFGTASHHPSFTRGRSLTTTTRPTYVLAGEDVQAASDDDMTREVQDDDDDDDTTTDAAPKNSRWDKLNQRIKNRIIKEGQDRAIANKKKREPAQDKKRRK